MQILEEYAFRFGNSNHLFNKWSSIKDNILSLRSNNASRSCFFKIDLDINKFLMVFKFLAPKGKRFENVCQSFLVHDLVFIQLQIYFNNKPNYFSRSFHIYLNFRIHQLSQRSLLTQTI